ncbi:hypothetical protein F383_36134 [Gossypium arboreum]|uniref:Uncharacterized protein n=1 Tax=Gossypium arboreum TaxID=29729 RepID=A0A0B0NAW7_GOSAR|nr:hypothetical protein F383_36134 [Gossypium arboreum]
MFGTCIGHIMRASVRPCLGHGIGTLPMIEAYGISSSVPNGSTARVINLST